MDQVRSVGRALGSGRGQALVEAAMVIPLLLLLLVGIMEIGRAWNIHQVVTDAARQGARTAAILNNTERTDQEVEDSAWAVVLVSLAAGSVKPSDVDPPDVKGANQGSDEPATVTVAVNYPFFVLAPVMAVAGLSHDGPVKLKSTAVMRNE